MNKQVYAFDQQGKPVLLTIRPYRNRDIPALISIQQECFPPPFPSDLWWNEEQLHEHTTRFPEGAICVEINGEIVASMTSLRVMTHEQDSPHTWAEITDNGYIRNHDSNGNTVYVVDISVRPAFRSLGLGKHMMQTMYELVVHLGVSRLLGGGRMSGYHLYADTLSPQNYLQQVMNGTLKDPVITFLLRCGRMPVEVIPNYLADEESHNHAVLMEWRNPFH